MDEAKKKAEEEAARIAAEKIEADKKAAGDVATAEIKKKLEEKEKELAGLKDKDFNFGKVTKSVEEKEKEIEELKKKVTEIETRPVTEAVNNTLDAFAGADAVLKEKIKFHFDRIGKEAKTATEVETLMKEAYLL